MKMKTVDLFCASPASTAICTSMNHNAMVRRPIHHRHHHHHHHPHNNHYQFDFDDHKPKFKTPNIIPCTSQRHIDPKPYTTYLKNHRKSTSTASAAITTATAATTTSSAARDDGAAVVRRKSSADVNDRSSPRGSSRYLLSDKPFIESLDSDEKKYNASALVVSEPPWPVYRDEDDDVVKQSFSNRSRSNDSPVLIKSKSSSNPAPQSPVLKSSRSRSHRDQVVELRVSIHCKGCEGKVRKHLARMEGVRSFNIDLESKKVTVVGDVTPLTLLSSISKVKNAQFWPSPSPLLPIRY